MSATSFTLPARILHWVMAPLLVAMLLIGTGMVATLSSWHPVLVNLHKHLGVALLVLATLRLLLRLISPVPSLPKSIPLFQKIAARASHLVIYGCMLAMPFIGWAMLSAAGEPLPGLGSMHLPPIASPSVETYSLLRNLHGLLGILFFITILVHIAAGLLHALILRDGVFESISLGRRKSTPHLKSQHR
jgi:cytochrome b561